MFTFAWGVYTSLFAEQAYKVLIIGLESSGKTTLMEQIKYTYSERNNSNSNNDNNNNNNNTSGEVHGGTTGDIPTVAPVSVMSKKRIRPTVGLNMARVTHRTIPPHLYKVSQRRSMSRESNSDGRTSDNFVSHLPGTSSVSVSGVSSTYTPISTRLTLWDVGGALRELWANYFSSCHGVIFVVDSTLAYSASSSTTTTTTTTTTTNTNTTTSTGNNNNNNNHTNVLSSNSHTHTVGGIVNSDNSNNNNKREMKSLSPSQSRTSCGDSGMATLSSPNCRGLATVLEHPMNVSNQNGMTRPSCSSYYYSSNNNNNDDEDERKKRKQLQRKVYAENSAILREVFCHPLLADAPLLIVSNKSDIIEHTSLEEIQDALGLVEMALMHQVYEEYSNSGEDNSSRRKSHSFHSDENSDGFAASLTSTTAVVTAAAETIPGTSGIGTKIMRLAEISALDGTGVREAMDWLVVQMRESKRVAETKDE